MVEHGVAEDEVEGRVREGQLGRLRADGADGDSEPARGMVRAVRHLVEVEEGR